MSEKDEQIALFQWITLNLKRFPKLRYAHSSLNGVKLNIGQAISAKKQGMIKGVPDIFIPIRNSKFNGLFIEMKSDKGRATPEQKDFIEYLNAEGFLAVICHSFEEAVSQIESYLQYPCSFG